MAKCIVDSGHDGVDSSRYALQMSEHEYKVLWALMGVLSSYPGTQTQISAKAFRKALGEPQNGQVPE